MAEGDKKEIANLVFKYDEALQGLEKIDIGLKELSTNSEKYFDKIQSGLNNAFQLKSSSIDNSKISKELNNTVNLSQKAYEQVEKKRLIAVNDADQQIRVIKERQVAREENLNNRIVNSTKSVYDKIADYAKTYLIYQGFNILRQSASELVNEMVNVEYQMVQISRVLNEDSLNINNYREQLIQLAHDYGNSFDNVADITLRLAQAGFDSNESLKLTETTLLALNTAELNATQATSDMVAIMSQWNLMTGDATQEAEDYAAIIDKINKVADNFPTTSADILEALKKTSSAFNLAGASIDETIALITTAEIASQRGGKAIGTAMSNIIQQLKEDKKLNIMEGMGINLYTDETKKEFNSVIDIITQLSEKMQQLKAEGKENSVEMQNLLSVFTVFRRNVGAGLLSGVAGEDSNYAKVLEASMNSLGYSIAENEKHMKTAKAAQEQFNATLLQLKTTVWDNGLEDVFRGMLVLGNDITNTFKTLIDTFGTIPTAIGAATLAFSAFNKQMKLQISYDSKKGFDFGFDGNLIEKINSAKKEVENFNKALKTTIPSNIEMSDSFRDFVNSVKPADVNAKNYIATLVKQKAATMAAQAATVALNAALSIGLSLAVTTVVGAINNLIHAEERAKEKTEELIQANNDEIQKSKERIDTINELIGNYEKLANIEGPLTNEQSTELEQYQKSITNYLIEQNEYTVAMVGNYDLQLQRLKEIREEQYKINLEKAKDNLKQQENLQGLTKQDTKQGLFDDILYQLNQAGIETAKYVGEIYPSLNRLTKLDFSTQVEALTQWKEQLEQAGMYGTEVWTWVSENLQKLNDQTNNLTEAQREYNNQVLEHEKFAFINENDINSLKEYQEALEKINDIEPPDDWTGTLEDFHAMLIQLVSEDFPEYEKTLTGVVDTSEAINSNFTELATEIENLSSQFDMVTKAANEFNTNGSITASTFKNIAENNLLEYLDVVNGKMVVNTQYFAEAAEAARQKAIADLQEQAAAEILQIVTNDLNGTLEETKTAAETGATGVSTISQQVINAAQDFMKGKVAAEQFNIALKELAGQSYAGDVSGLSENAMKQIDNVFSKLEKNTAKINALSLSVTKASSAAAARGAKSTTKTFEEQSQERVKIFKKEIDDLESLEKAWVNKYKKLELFSTSDLKFITQQRISRYNEYLNQINQLTGISEKDRTDLIREYTSKRQEAELEYFDLLKKQLDEQISALKEANKKRIKEIEDAADAQIAALRKVEDENDRIRDKEEYERKRQELISGYQGIEYWEQRTGREAQLALAEAKKKLEDLDRDWEEKKEGWTLDDQIQEIENARDAQIKAIEDAQEIQIKAWEDAYKKQVELYAQTGQIIYDGSVINAEYLYNAYMDNFVQPFNIRLQEVMSHVNSISAAADSAMQKVSNAYNKAQQLASQYPQYSQDFIGPRLDEGFEAYKRSLQNAGKFHGGGKVGTSTEALAIVRPDEVVLTPEWAAGLDKLIAQVNKGEVINNNASTVNNSITVDGNLVNLEGVKFNKREDVKVITEVIEKVLRDKYNINK